MPLHFCRKYNLKNPQNKDINVDKYMNEYCIFNLVFFFKFISERKNNIIIINLNLNNKLGDNFLHMQVIL